MMKTTALLLLCLAAGCSKSSSSDKPADPPATTAPKPAGDPAKPSDPTDPAKSDEAKAQDGDTQTVQPGRHHRRGGADKDGDGVVSDEERAEWRKQRTEAALKRLDANGDGKVTVVELKASTGRMHFDDPDAVDTNHDGVISADELEAAMKARRASGRIHRSGDGSDSGSAATP
jgi:hypothetical protein